MADDPVLDPLYVAARGVLLDALILLSPHLAAIVVVGAQAVYLRTGQGEVGITIAPYTTDGDLAVDPILLGSEPDLEALMEEGFEADHPGMWSKTVRIGGEDIVVPVDLIVPEGASSGEGRRAARSLRTENAGARRAVGLEAALVDHGPLTVTALDPADTRQVTVEVAGLAALLVAKAHKIHDRLEGGRPDRLSDKDAADVYRIMQTVRPADLGATIAGAPRRPTILNGHWPSDGVHEGPVRSTGGRWRCHGAESASTGCRSGSGGSSVCRLHRRFGLNRACPEPVTERSLPVAQGCCFESSPKSMEPNFSAASRCIGGVT